MSDKTPAYGMVEVRSFRTEEMVFEERAGVPMMRGLAVPYEKSSQDLGGFTEIIQTDAARDDVEGGKPIAMLWQHDTAHPISKTTARRRPLELKNTPKGVEFMQEAGSLTAEQRMRVEDGVVDQMSFGFRILKSAHEKWDELSSGKFLRTIFKMNLLEISPVTFPAYRSTKVAVRCAMSHGIIIRGDEAPTMSLPGESPAVEHFLREQEMALELALLGD